MLSPSAIECPCPLDSITLQDLEICSQLVTYEHMCEGLAFSWQLPLKVL